MKDVQMSSPTSEFSDLRETLALLGIKERNKTLDVIFARKVSSVPMELLYFR